MLRSNICLVKRLCGQVPVANVNIAQWRWYSNSNSNSNSNSGADKPPVDYIDKLMRKHPDVAYYGRELIQRCQESLLKAGFTRENSIKVIKGHPDILRFSAEQMEKRLEAWHVCNFSRTQFYDLFVQCPELIEFDDERYIANRFAALQQYVSTAKNVWRLFMSSPNLLADDMKTIREKIDYVLNDLEADEPDMVKSGALGLPILKIKSRHMLLSRMGLYKKRNWKASEMDPNKNPRLFRIMDCSDKEFAKNTCNGLSLKELEAFYELYERELQESKREALEYGELSDYDTEDDDDDDEFDARVNEDFYDDRYKRRYQQNSKSRVKKPYKKKKVL